MNATCRLLERVKKLRGIETNAEAARWLGVRPSAISNWLAGIAQAQPHTIAKMAEAVGEDVCEWLVMVEMERAHKAADRAVWRKVYGCLDPA